MPDDTLSRMTSQEIALIKAMLVRGKPAGFTAQRILSYFSRPDRTLNPARIYEIQDEKIGPNIPAASDVDLQQFLAEFGIRPFGSRFGVRNVWAPPPAYFAIISGRVAITGRNIEEDDPRTLLREKIAESQRRLADELSIDWDRFQVDQRMVKYVYQYIHLISNPPSDINIFNLDNVFRIIRTSIGADLGALGEIGEVQWTQFAKGHAVLTSLYPEMIEYRVALAELNDQAMLAEDETMQMIDLMRSSEGAEFVDPSVPDGIQKHVDLTREGNIEYKTGTYNVASLLNTAWGYIVGLVEFLPKAQSAYSSGTELVKQLGPLLQRILDKGDL